MIKIKQGISLKDKTSFKIGGIAKFFAWVSSKKELTEAYGFAEKEKLPIFILGDGTDILLSDRKFDVLVIKFTNQDFSIKKLKNGKYLVTAGAGLNWDDFVARTVEKNLQGVECLSGIPGTVGASPVQNIGAYGQEIKDTLRGVTAFDTRQKKFVMLNKGDCQFEYRDSIFKKEKGRYFIFAVTFLLNADRPPTLTYSSLLDYLQERRVKNPKLTEVRQAVLDIRNKKLENPDKIGNAGSFFKNPILSRKEFAKIKTKFADIPSFEFGGEIKIPAGWLIDQAGWKGKAVGGAAVSATNALVIVNSTGAAKAEEVRELAEKVRESVKNKFGITLEPEVQYINF